MASAEFSKVNAIRFSGKKPLDIGSCSDKNSPTMFQPFISKRKKQHYMLLKNSISEKDCRYCSSIQNSCKCAETANNKKNENINTNKQTTYISQRCEKITTETSENVSHIHSLTDENSNTALHVRSTKNQTRSSSDKSNSYETSSNSGKLCDSKDDISLFSTSIDNELQNKESNEKTESIKIRKNRIKEVSSVQETGNFGTKQINLHQYEANENIHSPLIHSFLSDIADSKNQKSSTSNTDTGNSMASCDTKIMNDMGSVLQLNNKYSVDTNSINTSFDSEGKMDSKIEENRSQNDLASEVHHSSNDEDSNNITTKKPNINDTQVHQSTQFFLESSKNTGVVDSTDQDIGISHLSSAADSVHLIADSPHASLSHEDDQDIQNPNDNVAFKTAENKNSSPVKLETQIGDSCPKCDSFQKEADGIKSQYIFNMQLLKQKLISSSEMIEEFHKRSQVLVNKDNIIKDLKNKLEASFNESAMLRIKLDNATNSNRPLQKTISQLRTQREAKEYAFNDLKKQLELSEKKVSSLRKELFSFKDSCDSSTKDKDDIIKLKDQESKKVLKQSKLIEKLNSKLEQTSKNYRNEKNLARTLQRQKDKWLQEKVKYEKEIKDLKMSNNTLKKSQLVKKNTVVATKKKPAVEVSKIRSPEISKSTSHASDESDEDKPSVNLVDELAVSSSDYSSDDYSNQSDDEMELGNPMLLDNFELENTMGSQDQLDVENEKNLEGLLRNLLERNSEFSNRKWDKSNLFIPPTLSPIPPSPQRQVLSKAETSKVNHDSLDDSSCSSSNFKNKVCKKRKAIDLSDIIFISKPKNILIDKPTISSNEKEFITKKMLTISENSIPISVENVEDSIFTDVRHIMEELINEVVEKIYDHEYIVLPSANIDLPSEYVDQSKEFADQSGKCTDDNLSKSVNPISNFLLNDIDFELQSCSSEEETTKRRTSSIVNKLLMQDDGLADNQDAIIGGMVPSSCIESNAKLNTDKEIIINSDETISLLKANTNTEKIIVKPLSSNKDAQVAPHLTIETTVVKPSIHNENSNSKASKIIDEEKLNTSLSKEESVFELSIKDKEKILEPSGNANREEASLQPTIDSEEIIIEKSMDSKDNEERILKPTICNTDTILKQTISSKETISTPIIYNEERILKPTICNTDTILKQTISSKETISTPIIHNEERILKPSVNSELESSFNNKEELLKKSSTNSDMTLETLNKDEDHKETYTQHPETPIFQNKSVSYESPRDRMFSTKVKGSDQETDISSEKDKTPPNSPGMFAVKNTYQINSEQLFNKDLSNKKTLNQTSRKHPLDKNPNSISNKLENNCHGRSIKPSVTNNELKMKEDRDDKLNEFAHDENDSEVASLSRLSKTNIHKHKFVSGSQHNSQPRKVWSAARRHTVPQSLNSVQYRNNHKREYSRRSSADMIWSLSPPLSPLPPSPRRSVLTPIISPLPTTPLPESVSPLPLSPKITSPPLIRTSAESDRENRNVCFPKPVPLNNSYKAAKVLNFTTNSIKNNSPNISSKNPVKHSERNDKKEEACSKVDNSRLGKKSDEVKNYEPIKILRKSYQITDQKKRETINKLKNSQPINELENFQPINEVEKSQPINEESNPPLKKKRKHERQEPRIDVSPERRDLQIAKHSDALPYNIPNTDVIDEPTGVRKRKMIEQNPELNKTHFQNSRKVTLSTNNRKIEGAALPDNNTKPSLSLDSERENEGISNKTEKDASRTVESSTDNINSFNEHDKKKPVVSQNSQSNNKKDGNIVRVETPVSMKSMDLIRVNEPLVKLSKSCYKKRKWESSLVFVRKLLKSKDMHMELFINLLNENQIDVQSLGRAIVDVLKKSDQYLDIHSIGSEIKVDKEPQHSNVEFSNVKKTPMMTGYEFKLISIIQDLSQTEMYKSVVLVVIDLLKKEFFINEKQRLMTEKMILWRFYAACCRLQDDLHELSATLLGYFADNSTTTDLPYMFLMFYCVWPCVVGERDLLRINSKTGVLDVTSIKSSPLLTTIQLVSLVIAIENQEHTLVKVLSKIFVEGRMNFESPRQYYITIIDELFKLLTDKTLSSLHISSTNSCSVVLNPYARSTIDAIKILCKQLGWQWTYNECISKIIWQYADNWSRNDEIEDDTFAILLILLRELCQHGCLSGYYRFQDMFNFLEGLFNMLIRDAAVKQYLTVVVLEAMVILKPAVNFKDRLIKCFMTASANGLTLPSELRTRFFK